MSYKITVEQDFLRAELFDRETAEETRDFLHAVVRYSARYPCILIQVRSSRPIFQAEQHALIEDFNELAQSPSHQIALLADTAELHASHEYLELITRQRGLNVRTFRSEAGALHWLKARRPPPEQPWQPDRRQLEDRRQLGDWHQLETDVEGKKRGTT